MSISKKQHVPEKLLDNHVKSECTVLEFTSRELASEQLQLYITQRLYRNGRISENVRLQLELAFQEVITNALEHGNLELDSTWREKINVAGIDQYAEIKKERLNDDQYALRKVLVEMGYDEKAIKIRVRDEGKGFKVKRAPKVSKKSDELPVCSGRGLALIYEAADEVHFNDQGNEIILLRYL